MPMVTPIVALMPTTIVDSSSASRAPCSSCDSVSTPRILFRHIAPNLIAPILVQVSLSFGNVIAAEASLSFLGLGPQVDHTWGAMLEQGTSFLWKPGFRHYALAAGAAIAWVVLAANLLGDGGEGGGRGGHQQGEGELLHAPVEPAQRGCERGRYTNSIHTSPSITRAR